MKKTKTNVDVVRYAFTPGEVHEALANFLEDKHSEALPQKTRLETYVRENEDPADLVTAWVIVEYQGDTTTQQTYAQKRYANEKANL